MADDETKLEDGTYLVMNVSALGKCLTYNKGKYIIQTRQDRGPQICTVATENDESTLFFPLTGKVPYVNQFYTSKDEEADSDHKKNTPKPNQNVIGGAYTGGKAARWKIIPVPNETIEYITYNGKQYHTYWILNATSSNDEELGIVMAPNSTSENANVITRWKDVASGVDLRHWFFVPINTIPAGYYNIRTATAVDRVLRNETNNSCVMSTLTTRNDNRDVWMIGNYNNQGQCYVVNLETSKAMWIPPNNRRIGGKPVCGTLTSGKESWWVIRNAGVSNKLNDSYYNSFIMLTPYYMTDISENAVVDAFYTNDTSPRTLPDLRRSTGDRRQQWFVTPAEAYDKNLPVPSKPSLDYNDAVHYGTISIPEGEFSVYPSWVGQGDAWQLRYRFTDLYLADGLGRTKVTPDDTQWHSIFDDDVANEGWGDIGAYNCDAELIYNEANVTSKAAAGRYRSVFPIHVNSVKYKGEEYTLGYYDENSSDKHFVRIGIEFQVRPWSPTYSSIEGLAAHGGSVSLVSAIEIRPELIVSSLVVEQDGLYIVYNTKGVNYNGVRISLGDSPYFKDDGCPYEERVAVTGYEYRPSGADPWPWYTLTPVERWETVTRYKNTDISPVSGKYYLSFSDILPLDGDEVPINWTITDSNGFSHSGTTMVSVDSQLGNAPTYILSSDMYHFTDNGSRILLVNFSSMSDDDHLARNYVRINHRESKTVVRSEFDLTAENAMYLDTVEIPETDNHILSFPIPFKRTSIVQSYRYVTDYDGYTGIAIFEMYFPANEAYRAQTRMWNWGACANDDEWFEIFVNVDDNPTENVSTSLTNNSIKTTERSWELTQFGNVPEQTRDIDGVIYRPLMDDYMVRIQKFALCKYAWYRSFDGELIRVAITDVKEERLTWGIKISVSMRRVDG